MYKEYTSSSIRYAASVEEALSYYDAGKTYATCKDVYNKLPKLIKESARVCVIEK